MATPAKWRWDSSNGNATAAQTQTAYRALTVAGDVGKGPTRNFSVIVWNDLVDKVIEQRQAWGDTDWTIAAPATKGQTWMIPGEQMTAKIFNSVVANMPPIHPWGWEATLGRKEIRKGDVCYGAYFIFLTDGINHWIDLTPLRFIVSFPIHATISPNALVRRTLHIINHQNLRWYPRAKIMPFRALHTKGSLVVTSDIRLDLPLFHTQHISLPLFYNLRMRNHTAVTTASPIVIDNPVQLTITGRITFGDVVFLICAVDGQSNLSGTLSIPPSVPILIDNTVELTSTGDVTVSTPENFIASVLGQFIGEAWIREPDSVLVKENLEIAHSASLKFTFSDILNIIAALNTELSPTAKVTVSDIRDIVAALNIALDPQATITGNEATQLKGDLAIQHTLHAMMYRRQFSTHSGNLPIELITTAKIGTAPLELYTAADLLMQSSMSATASFDNNGIYTGADIAMQLVMTARAELQNNKLPFAVNITDMLFSSSAKAAVNPNIMRTGATLSDTIIGPTAAITINPGNVLPLGAQLTDTTELSATISTFNNQLYAAGAIEAEHTGSGTLELTDAAGFGGNASAEHTGSATLDLDNAIQIRANAGFNHTASATITTQHYVLASELDDELASDLDDILVIDLEFSY